ncbi:TPA: hypothetical protein IEO43_004640, partial [Escherichia coli]|nr:hypothetical protein [Escherichia coli]
TQVLANFESLERLTNEVSQKIEIEKELAQQLSKKEAYEKQNVGELMKLHSGLIEEAALRIDLESSLSELKKRYEAVLSDKSDINELLAIDIDKVQVGKEHLSNVIKIIQSFSDVVDTHQKELNKELTQKLDLLRNEILEWRQKEKGARDR